MGCGLWYRGRSERRGPWGTNPRRALCWDTMAIGRGVTSITGSTPMLGFFILFYFIFWNALGVQLSKCWRPDQESHQGAGFMCVAFRAPWPESRRSEDKATELFVFLIGRKQRSKSTLARRKRYIKMRWGLKQHMYISNQLLCYPTFCSLCINTAVQCTHTCQLHPQPWCAQTPED